VSDDEGVADEEAIPDEVDTERVPQMVAGRHPDGTAPASCRSLEHLAPPCGQTVRHGLMVWTESDWSQEATSASMPRETRWLL
jgi:hypothetical protein